MNILYPSYKDGLLNGDYSWALDQIRIALYDAPAVYDPVHVNISDLAGTQIAPGENLAGKFTTDGAPGSDPALYTGLVNPLDVAVAVMYRGSDGDLIAYMDQVNGFSFLPTGANYTLTPGGPGGVWFSL